MQQVGNRLTFAIEWQKLWKRDQVVHGNFCFWADGNQIGDYKEDVLLSRTAELLRQFLSHAKQRLLPKLEGKPKEDIFSYVYETGIVTTQVNETLDHAVKRTMKEIRGSSQHDWALHSHLRTVFHLDDIGDSAFRDKINIILVTDDLTHGQRLIWRDLSNMKLSEAFLPDSLFDGTAEVFLQMYLNTA